MLGKETITVDADIVQRQLGMVLGLDNRIPFSLVDVMEEVCGLSQACVRHRDIARLQFLPIARHVQDMAAKEKVKSDPDIIRRACDDLRLLGDFVVIDSPPGYRSRLETIAPADEVLVVVMPWRHTVSAAERLIESVKLRGRYNMHLVVNHMRPEKRRHRDGMLSANEVLEILQLDLLGIVPEDDCVTASRHRGEFAALRPGSAAGQEYRNIARRLLGEEVPLTMF